MRDDIPQTDDSIRKALEAQAAEREKAQQESGHAFIFSEHGPVELAPEALVNELRAMARTNLYPFPQNENDELFTAPSAYARFDQLQVAECEAVEEIADRLAEVAHGADGVSALTDRKQQATVRFLACHALRLTQEHWQHAATEAAIQKCFDWMRHEGGIRFRHLPDYELEAIAVFLAPKIVGAYHGISEGTAALSPARYLRIVGGEEL